MVEELKKLLAVQEKDVEMIKLEDEKKALPQLLNQLKGWVDAKNREVEAAKTLLKEIQVAHKKLEIDLESKNTVRQKQEAQLMAVKTNQEYKALEKEIFGAKTEMSRIEDEILEKWVTLDTQNAAIRKVEAELQEVKSQFSRKEEEIQGKMKVIEERLEALKKERESLVKDVDPVFFKRYTRILAHVHGIAIVPIVDRSCQGCHTLLPPQVMVNVRKETELISCENCARLLFIPEEGASSTADIPHSAEQGTP
ncbi:MAG: hypothetical protein HYS08_09975 [Chlamydiae bacterium]|nr:hypothetical protein [Chlamydiota bacterium]MBI3267025.1 hypothetical protein [Chlamydiota bacterium]